jgi:hypothetical protein
MNIDDEALQKSIEEGKSFKDDADARAYQHVFRALQNDPGYDLSLAFAENVMQKAAVNRRRESANDFIWFGIGIFLLVIAFIVALIISLVFIGFKPSLGFLGGLSAYKGLIVVAIVMIVIFSKLEKRLMRHT